MDPFGEAQLGKAYDARLVRRLWGYVRPYRSWFALALACMPLVLAFALVQPYVLKIAIDRFVVQQDPSGLALMVGAYLAALGGEFLAYYWQYYCTMLVAQRSLADLRIDIFRHVQRLPMAYFDRNPVGRLVTRMTTDVDVLNEMLAAGGMTIFMDVLTVVGIVGIMLAIDARLTLMSLVLLPALGLALNFFRIAARRTYRRIRERIARINAYLQEAISGMGVIQLFAREDRAFADFASLNAAHRDANHQANRYEAALFSVVEGFETASKALVLWYAAGGEVVTIGTILAFSEYVQRLFVPLRDFSAKYAVMQSAMTAAERVFELLDTPLAPGYGSAPGAPRPPARGVIEFDRVSFAYNGTDDVLRDVTFRVAPGERIALVGATGSGKSTIVKLLGRFYDVDRGRIRVDGVDVKEWSLDALRRHIGVVLQDVFLFSGTIAENVAFGRPELTPAVVEDVARRVHADRVVARLPQRWQTPLRERGNNLSAGERQLLSLARALVYDPAILVLDEATSSVDPETEGLIQEGLRTLLQGRTALLIAHRLSTIESADRILVLHKGKLREEGTHGELLARGGIYARLWRLQYAAVAGREAAPSAPPVGG